MKREELIRWIAVRGCVTAREVAEALGVRLHTARERLGRLKRRGLLRLVWRSQTAWWCVPGAEPPAARRVVSRRRQKTNYILHKTEELLRGGCAATSTLMRELMLSHSQALYALRLLQRRGRVVEVVVGKVALWCRDRETAQCFLEEVRGAVIRLVEQNRLRYIRPKQLFELITRDAKAREVFGRIIDVKTPPSAKTYGVLKTLLEAMYGKPVAKSVYYVAQPANSVSIDTRDETGEHVQVKLPPHLALALRNADVNEVALQALEQLLQRYRP
jgi:Mn-dependent DtxR family transcriptional regulator